MSIELLDEIHAKGLAAAHVHFASLVEYMNRVLPAGANDTIPKTLEDVAGLFSASTKEFHLSILHDKPGYEALSAVFEYRPSAIGEPQSEWALKKFSVLIGDGSMFQLPKEYTATCIEDALVLSKRIAKYREQYKADSITMPDTATTRPN